MERPNNAIEWLANIRELGLHYEDADKIVVYLSALEGAVEILEDKLANAKAFIAADRAELQQQGHVIVTTEDAAKAAAFDEILDQLHDLIVRPVEDHNEPGGPRAIRRRLRDDMHRILKNHYRAMTGEELELAVPEDEPIGRI